jgi:hypothetical protein
MLLIRFVGFLNEVPVDIAPDNISDFVLILKRTIPCVTEQATGFASVGFVVPTCE